MKAIRKDMSSSNLNLPGTGTRRFLHRVIRETLSPIKLGNLIMRTFAIVVALTCLSSPAFAQTPCSGMGVAKKEFVENFNSANAAMSASNFAGAISLAEAARPYALTPMQLSAANQVAIAAAYQIDRAAAKPRVAAALSDPCLSPTVREKYEQMLAE
ncbi:MAG: hypothetical protein ABW042_02305 [Phenylobacterium sp.]